MTDQEKKLGTCDNGACNGKFRHAKQSGCVNWREQPAQPYRHSNGEIDFANGDRVRFTNGWWMADRKGAQSSKHKTPQEAELALAGEQPAQGEPPHATCKHCLKPIHFEADGHWVHDKYNKLCGATQFGMWPEPAGPVEGISAERRANAAEGDLLRISKAMNQPGMHLEPIADRAIRLIGELREELAALKEDAWGWKRRAERSESALAEARMSLVRYGTHIEDCTWFDDIKTCDCGLRDALTALKSKPELTEGGEK